MKLHASTKAVEFTVRSDLVAAARKMAAERDVTLSAVTAWALGVYLAAGHPPPSMSAADRVRLPVRLPVKLIDDLVVAAAQAGVSHRLIVEGALAAAFAPARGPGWDPNSAVR